MASPETMAAKESPAADAFVSRGCEKRIKRTQYHNAGAKNWRRVGHKANNEQRAFSIRANKTAEFNVRQAVMKEERMSQEKWSSLMSICQEKLTFATFLYMDTFGEKNT